MLTLFHSQWMLPDLLRIFNLYVRFQASVVYAFHSSILTGLISAGVNLIGRPIAKNMADHHAFVSCHLKYLTKYSGKHPKGNMVTN